MINKQKKILLKTYTDTLTVLRFKKIKTNLGETKLVKEAVYENEPCYLSIGTVRTGEKEEITYRTDNEYLIFTENTVKMLENDEVIITRRDGETYKGKTSRSYVFDTHCETSLKVSEVV